VTSDTPAVRLATAPAPTAAAEVPRGRPRTKRQRRRPRGLLRARAAAAWADVSLRTWRSWDAGGLIPRPVRIGGCVLWSLAELRAWRDAGCPDRRTWEARAEQ
jgi:hypothetical protein